MKAIQFGQIKVFELSRNKVQTAREIKTGKEIEFDSYSLQAERDVIDLKRNGENVGTYGVRMANDSNAMRPGHVIDSLDLIRK